MKYQGFVALTITAALFYQTPGGPGSVVPMSGVRVGTVKAAEIKLGSLLEQLSENTNVAFCVESRGEAEATSLGSIYVDLNVAPEEDLGTVLVQLQQKYPAIKWRLNQGTVVISSAGIKDDPLDLPVQPFSFQGTIGDLVRELNAKVPGLLANTLEISGMYDRRATYSLKFNTEITVREFLGALTRDYGIRWTAIIRADGMRVQIPNAENGKPTETRSGRVTLVFSQGRIPQLVR
jgi:hypothetical protein